MSISDLSVNRPVLASVFSLLIVLVGLISFTRLPIREYPDIDAPIVTVTTVYPGANAEVIESELTNVIEEELTSISGIKSLISNSRDQVSSVVVEFELSKNIDTAAQDVREKVSRIASKLPDNANDPQIAKAEADASPIMWILIKSDKRDLLELSEYVDSNIKDYFQTINGVSKVIFGGEKRKSIQVLLDPQKLAYHGLSVLDLEKAMRDNNLELPGGLIESKNTEFSVKVDATLKTVEAYANLIVKQTPTGVIRLSDVADIKEGAENDRSFVRFNGEKGFGLGVVKQSKANTIQISDEVHKRIRELKTKIPKDISMEVGFDSAKFIKYSIEDLFFTVLFSSLLVIIIIFLFLRNLRSTLIPAISIPISIIGVMGGLAVLGFTINLMTLLGLVIAIGIVVDDSIIVLENVYRKIEEGYDPKLAAKEGTKEITLAVMATTLVLIVIFLPVAFLKGLSGRLLSEFAFSLCFATLISAFVALTLAPMLCSKILRHNGTVAKRTSSRKTFIGKILGAIGDLYDFIENTYVSSIPFCLRHKRLIVILSAISCSLISAAMFTYIPKDFIPNEDRGNFLTLIQTRTGTNLDYLDKQMRKAENILNKIPEMDTIISVAAFGRDGPGKVNQGIMINRLIPWDERSKNVFAIAGPLFETFRSIPEAFVLPIFPSSGPETGFGSLPIEIVLKSQNIDFLSKLSKKILAEANSLPRLIFSKSDLSFNKPELEVRIDRDKAQKLGVNMREIARSLQILFASDDLTEFNLKGENYKVIARLPKYEKDEIRKLGEVPIKTESGQLIALSNLIEVTPKVGVEEWNHLNRRRSVSIQAVPVPGVPASEGLRDLEKLIFKIVAESPDKPVDFEIDYKGVSREEKESNTALYITFAIALLFAYLFLAGQFESFRSPLVILFTVPLAITGGLLGLAVFQLSPLITKTAIALGAPFWIQFVIPQFNNISINIYSQIGIVMLIGLASKNGILLVEFIDQQREKMPVYDAIQAACRLRLRPILMTALATVLGILPIALATGIGSQSRQSLGVVIVAGMLFSTFLTLFIIPCLYAWIGRKDVKLSL
ncbi:MAG: efflux RND transporter permease subunit [Candidatus Melainabacteria bacterium]|nr:efflux RND transporter permease subunit [Candidatus Melainabacteria bacterium]